MRAPGPKFNMAFHLAIRSPKESLIMLQSLEQKYGDVAGFRFGPFDVTFVANPDYIEQVLLNRETYIKINEPTGLRYLLGNGLLTNEGDFWLKQRRLIQPIFHKQRLEFFSSMIADATGEMLAEWEKKQGRTTDIFSEMNSLTLDVVNRTLFSTNIKGESEKISNAITNILKAFRRRAQFLRVPLWLPVPNHLRIRYYRQVLYETIEKIIGSRKLLTDQPNDLLTMLMEVEDADTRERMTEQQLRDEVLTIFIAGHETTANALTFAIYLLSKHPEAKAKLQQEADEVLKDGKISFEQLGKLEYTTMVAKEAMRLYPPAWIMPRQVAQEDSIGGYQVKKGDMVIVSPFVMHKSSRFWENPDTFRPERFQPEHMRGKPRYAYFPFGGGARLCVGNNFAMMELQIILAKIYRQYDLQVPDNFTIDLFPSVTLRPDSRVPVKVIKRNL